MIATYPVHLNTLMSFRSLILDNENSILFCVVYKNFVSLRYGCSSSMRTKQTETL